MDFTKHNEEQAAVWAAYAAGKPIRVPMTLGIFQRYTMFNYEVNRDRFTFRDYFTDPEVLLKHNLQQQYYVKHNIPFDQEMGIPENGWDVMIDLQNLHEGAWLGGTIEFPENQVPLVKPFLNEDNKNSIFDKGIPEVYTGIYETVRYFYEYLTDKKKSGYEFCGKSFNIPAMTGVGTDGPLTVCCDIRGAGEFLTDLVCDEDYAMRLLDFVTEAAIKRIKTFKKDFYGEGAVWPVFGFTDDSIQLISEKTYKEKIMPFHQKLLDALREDSPDVLCHICGDAQRHHRVMAEELGVTIFDTGYPMDFAKERSLVGDNVHIYGGVPVPFLETASYDEVYAETERILRSGIADSGRFVLREANNLSAAVPIENLWAMYDCVRNTKLYQ